MRKPPPKAARTATRLEVGAVRGAYGLKGWIRIAPYATDESVLTQVRELWFDGEVSTPFKVESARRHGRAIVAKLVGIETPEQGEALKGAIVLVERSALPPLKLGEAYWADLIGAHVVNRSGRKLGKVLGVRNFGAQDLMEVMLETEARTKAGRSLLIPMVEDYVESIDAVAGLVKVDWEPDWL